MGKTLEDLELSRAGREKILIEFGEVPQSIMLYNKSLQSIDISAKERCYQRNTDELIEKYGRLAKAFSTSDTKGHHTSVRGSEDAALSRFPQNIGRTVLKLYTKEGDTVIDPFAGHNSRMELCWRLNRHYKGQDLSKKFMQYNEIIKDMLLKEKEDDMFSNMFTADIELKEGDSRKLQFDNECANFCITSPPYWNLEFYGNEPEQLGKNTYNKFLDGLQLVMQDVFRCLKKDSFCCIFINDFRKDGKFYSYHSDVIRLMLDVGFMQHDIIIVDLGSSIGAAFANQIIERKIVAKRHEYCLVFKKVSSHVKYKKDVVVEPTKDIVYGVDVDVEEIDYDNLLQKDIFGNDIEIETESKHNGKVDVDILSKKMYKCNLLLKACYAVDENDFCIKFKKTTKELKNKKYICKGE